MPVPSALGTADYLVLDVAKVRRNREYARHELEPGRRPPADQAAPLRITPASSESYPQADIRSHKRSTSGYIRGMTGQPSIADTFTLGDNPAGAVRAAVGGAADGVGRADALLGAADAVARLGTTSAAYDALSDAEALAGQKTIARAQHELDTRKAWMAKTLAHRSRWELGQEGLAKKQGFLSPEDLIQDLTGTTRVESRKLVGVGQMLGEAEESAATAQAAADAAPEAEAARRLLDQQSYPNGAPEPVAPPLPPVPAPWHAPISHAVSNGILSIDAAHALRTGLGDIDAVVTGPVLADALAGLLDEARTLNADRLLKRARQTRDSLDADGIRKREQKAWDDRYLRIWTLNTGQVRVDGLFPPEQGEFIKSTFDSFTSPRRGGVRFVDPQRAAWARRVQNDPRTTTQITCDGFFDLLKAGTTINPNQMLGGRRPAVQIITTANPTPRPAGPAAPAGSTRPITDANTGPGEATAPPRSEVTALDRPLQFLRVAEEIVICGPGQGGHGYLEGNSAPVSAETIERLICDSGSVDLRLDDLGRPLNMGREDRVFSRAQRRALAGRDGGCMWPGCDRPPAFTEVHHINHWSRDDGRTDINQGILLCSAHHLLLHNQRWQVFENAGVYWLRPPITIDPGQVLVEMPGRMG